MNKYDMGNDKVNKEKELFNSLNIPDWKFQGNPRIGGQAWGVEVRNENTKDLGFFRCLKSDKKIDQDRFKRELNILTNPKFQHENIIEILDYSIDGPNLWYISRRGRPFDQWWLNTIRKPTLPIFDKAINVILKILSGLSLLHEQNLVHRDIKPQNIVIGENDEPILIDFGILFEPAEDRLTPIEEAVGNKQYSPDYMMNREEEVPPWIDLFQIGQLLIWMLSIKPAKHYWNRPLHWKYVRYRSDLDDYQVSVVRSITALVSSFSTSPNNASELIGLINLIKVNPTLNATSDVSNAIMKRLANNKISEYQRKVDDAERIDNNFQLMCVFEEIISNKILEHVNNLDSNLYQIITNIRLKDLSQHYIGLGEYEFDYHSSTSGKYYKNLLIINFGMQDATSFKLAISVRDANTFLYGTISTR